MLNKELIEDVLKDADDIPTAAAKFKQYPKDVLTFNPSGGWSAAECFDHLILINEKYIPIFTELNIKYTDAGDKKFKNSFMGKFLIRSLHPDNVKKTKTMARFYPARQDADRNIIDEYLRQHSEIRSFIESFKRLDIKKIKITSPLSSIVRYNLGDACRIIVYHDLRHLKQALRAVEDYFSRKKEIG